MEEQKLKQVVMQAQLDEVVENQKLLNQRQEIMAKQQMEIIQKWDKMGTGIDAILEMMMSMQSHRIYMYTCFYLFLNTQLIFASEIHYFFF